MKRAGKEMQQKKNLNASSEVEEDQSETERVNSESEESIDNPKQFKITKQNCAKIIVNVFNTQYDVVKDVMKDTFKFVVSMEAEGEWDLCWADTGVTAVTLIKMKKYQTINHYPGMVCLARKNYLGKNLMRMRKEFPKEYKFFPPTWLLPFEYNEWKNQFTQKKPKTYIFKPEALSQGKGIFLTRSWESINPTEHYVVQRYIHNPYLIEGLKFDLRIYVLVYGCDPLRIFIYKEGLARLATEKYVQPVGANLGNMYIHLTNYAINKNSYKFVFNKNPENAEVGHKRSLTFVWKYIDAHGGNSQEILEKIKDCIIKTLCAVQPQLSESCRSCQPLDDKNSMCFEILGFDILIDHKFKPWLLEVNHSPSFTTDTPFDRKIKSELVYDTVRLLNLNSNKRLKFYKKKQRDLQARMNGKTTGLKKMPKLTQEERYLKKKKHMEKRDKYEASNCGGYIRIYPKEKEEDNKIYNDIIMAALKMRNSMSKSRKTSEIQETKKQPKKTYFRPNKPNNTMKNMGGNMHSNTQNTQMSTFRQYTSSACWSQRTKLRNMEGQKDNTKSQVFVIEPQFVRCKTPNIDISEKGKVVSYLKNQQISNMVYQRVNMKDVPKVFSILPFLDNDLMPKEKTKGEGKQIKEENTIRSSENGHRKTNQIIHKIQNCSLKMPEFNFSFYTTKFGEKIQNKLLPSIAYNPGNANAPLIKNSVSGSFTAREITKSNQKDYHYNCIKRKGNNNNNGGGGYLIPKVLEFCTKGQLTPFDIHTKCN